MESLLLRLFRSDFFGPWIAVSYLFRYPEVGIQAYLCQRLLEFPLADIEFFLPQLCHLLTTRPEGSIFLEQFLLEIAHRSAHVAVQIVLHLESYCNDYRKSKNYLHYKHSSNMLVKFQELSMEEPDRELQSPVQSHNISSCIVGVGCIAGMFGGSGILEAGARMAIHQGGTVSWTAKSTSTKTRSKVRPYPPSLEEFHRGRAFVPRLQYSRDGKTESPRIDRPRSACGYQCEIEFIKSLVDISWRLTRIPKEARQKALQAELNLLNYNLPADVCIPVWCSQNTTNNHDKVVRIAPDEAIVLDSVEKAPYLIMVEVLENESGCSFQDMMQLCTKTRFKTHKSQSEACSSGNHPVSPMSDEFDQDLGAKVMEHLRSGKEFKSMELFQRLTGANKTIENPACGIEDFEERMRTAAILLAQLEKIIVHKAPLFAMINQIRGRIIKEMEKLELERLTRLAANSKALWNVDDQILPTTTCAEKPAVVEDRSLTLCSERWSSRMERLCKNSPFGSQKNWKAYSIIVKWGTDLRQEQLASQILREMSNIWKEENVSAWVYCPKVLVTSDLSGIIETVPDSASIHSIKKRAWIRSCIQPGFSYSLMDHFVSMFGNVGSEPFSQAQTGFLESLVGYSLVTYLLALKDRHNANILLDSRGKLVHIDFEFMLSNSPGYMGFETAPFKLTQEYIDILGGFGSEMFVRFKQDLISGFIALRKHAERILLMAEMIFRDSKLPCFGSGEASIQHLRERFQLGLTDTQIREYVERLVTSSSLNVFTRLYDAFQYYSNGILY